LASIARFDVVPEEISTAASRIHSQTADFPRLSLASAEKIMDWLF
jgi:hypothetical protein